MTRRYFMVSEEVASQFWALGPAVYLNTATLGIGSDSAVAALRMASEDWARGQFDFRVAERAGEECREMFASLIHARSEDIAIIPTASAVAGQVAAHLALRCKGGNILVGTEEYTSNVYAWRMLEAHGFEVRTIPHYNGGPQASDFAAAADIRTRLIAISAVQSATGWRADLAAMRSIANQSGALLYVDAAQLAGALDFDAPALGIDALAAPAHKFLLGTRGMGYAYFAPTLRDAMSPVAPGWKAAAEPLSSFFGPDIRLSASASRFDQSLSWFNALADRESLRLLSGVGMAAITTHNTDLMANLSEGLRMAGIDCQDHPPGFRSTLLSLMPRRTDTAARLAAEGVVVSMRAGRIRLSVHIYNTIEQIDRLIRLLST
jgi:cysteine desulfurase/selenocysteine lyase